LQKVISGKTYDLAVDLFIGMPNCCSDPFGDPSYQIWMTHAPSRDGTDQLVAHSSDAILMSTHTGTHIDALSHFGLHGKIWNQADATDNVTVSGWSKSSIASYPPITARGILIDVAKAKGLQHLPNSYAISIDDLKTALEAQNTNIQPGDVVLIRTGMMTLWPDSSKLKLFTQPGLSLEAARWLVEEKQVMLLGADNFGLESFPSHRQDNFAPVHTYLLAEKGVSFIELLWLEDLAKDELYEFMFMSSPLKLRGATGSPIRPLAFPIKQ
jgi:kynurenine formamidase